MIVDPDANEQSPDPVVTAKIEALAGYGLSGAEIAHVLGISEEALLRSHAGSIESGRIKSNARVAESLFRKATGEGYGAVTAAIFWLKTRARWKETSIQELAPASDAVITVQIGGLPQETLGGASFGAPTRLVPAPTGPDRTGPEAETPPPNMAAAWKNRSTSMACTCLWAPSEHTANGGLQCAHEETF